MILWTSHRLKIVPNLNRIWQTFQINLGRILYLRIWKSQLPFSCLPSIGLDSRSLFFSRSIFPAHVFLHFSTPLCKYLHPTWPSCLARFSFHLKTALYSSVFQEQTRIPHHVCDLIQSYCFDPIPRRKISPKNARQLLCCSIVFSIQYNFWISWTAAVIWHLFLFRKAHIFFWQALGPKPEMFRARGLRGDQG